MLELWGILIFTVIVIFPEILGEYTEKKQNSKRTRITS
jgi:hypothetical protein